MKKLIANCLCENYEAVAHLEKGAARSMSNETPIPLHPQTLKLSNPQILKFSHSHTLTLSNSQTLKVSLKSAAAAA